MVERGSTVRLKHVYTNLDGTPTAPISPKVSIYEPSRSKKVDAATPVATGTGQEYRYDLAVSLTDLVGYWMVEWLDGTVVQPALSNNPAREIFHVVQTEAGVHPARQPVQVG